MKIVEVQDVISAGAFPRSPTWKRACAEVEDAIGCVDWPLGSGTFSINPKRHGNGVKPIKRPCTGRLEQLGWRVEAFPPLASNVLRPGDLDALVVRDGHYIAFEWETGNISSSHRALNKLVLGLIHRAVTGCFLVVPSRALYPYLTDRIGNMGELKPYLPLWNAASEKVKDAALRIYAVEHDLTDEKVATIPKGTDGRALR
ncbi:MAG: restriction endonuclease [Solirubrobacterales bacterium]|nr:restriction endonuclease [Solirubrobacterales bacterium]